MNASNFRLHVSMLAVAAVMTLGAGTASAQDVVAALAEKVVQKYQNTSCEDLKAQKSAPKEPPTKVEAAVIGKLKSDPAMRKRFVDMIAGPIANRMFDCGMVP